MSDSRMLICGGLLILCGALYYFNAPFIMRKSLRGIPLVKAYMKKVGVILAVLGVLCGAWTFVGAGATLALKIVFGALVAAGMIYWILCNNKLAKALQKAKEEMITDK